ncbi:VOC family protein [Streptomyces sp. S5]|uniref:VOC family protein n=1 Tax=Streptomyces sp. S5 TaxID=1456735 RepID=UPI000EF935FA|nr:VOC family protein [Streptomyces sp. S5]
MRASPVHGMDHVGVTVPDIDQATRFFEDAFDAELIYESKALSDEPGEGAETEQTLHLFPGTKVRAVRMIRLCYGPGVELFQMEGPEQREAARPSDYGLQHLAIYVDDIHAAIAQFEAAGGTVFAQPQVLMFGPEMGKGNVFCYGKTPWGSVVELLTYPSPMPYEEHTPLRRWRP